MGKAVGLSPATMTEGGGLLNDVDGVIKAAEVVMYDYNGKSPVESPALHLTIEVDGEDHEQYWSVGQARDWAPSKDGKCIEALRGQTGLNRGSNAAILLQSFVESGFPEDSIEDDVTCFVGLDAHWIRVPAPERPGLKRTPREDGNTYDPQVLVINNVNALPGDKKAGKAKTGGKAKAGGGGDAKAKAEEIVMELLADNPEGVKKSELPKAAYSALKNDPLRNEVAKIVFSDDFLNSGPWEYKNGVVKLG